MAPGADTSYYMAAENDREKANAFVDKITAAILESNILEDYYHRTYRNLSPSNRHLVKLHITSDVPEAQAELLERIKACIHGAKRENRKDVVCERRSQVILGEQEFIDEIDYFLEDVRKEDGKIDYLRLNLYQNQGVSLNIGADSKVFDYEFLYDRF